MHIDFLFDEVGILLSLKYDSRGFFSINFDLDN